MLKGEEQYEEILFHVDRCRFRVFSLLGGGNSGRVYLALQLEPEERLVAVKYLNDKGSLGYQQVLVEHVGFVSHLYIVDSNLLLLDNILPTSKLCMHMPYFPFGAL